MGANSRTERDSLTVFLLAAIAGELTLNRLLVPALRPNTGAAAGWYEQLDRVALFVFYFASALAVVTLGRWLVDAVRSRAYPRPMALALVAAGAGFTALGAIAIAAPLADGFTFAFQLSFTLTLILVLAAHVRQPGDVRTKVGIAIVAVPLLLHAYAPLALRLLFDADPSMGSNLPDGALHLPERIQHVGQWALVTAGLLAPYCFSPRPLAANLVRPGPFIAAGSVAIVGAVVVRNYYEDGMRLAMTGLGVDLGPAAPSSLIALYLLALASVTWTLVACWSADSLARRHIGVGLGLLVTVGYGFSWPMMYLVPIVGLLTMGAAARVVEDEERRNDALSPSFRTPPIDEQTWQRYVESVAQELRRDSAAAEIATSAVTTDNQGVRNTTIATVRRDIAVTVRITRAAGSIGSIDIQLGHTVDPGVAPAWTLHARPERRLAIDAHPAPPATDAPITKTNDEAFDRRFRVRDRKAYTGILLDDGLRARATALVDGWLAYWPGTCLYFRVVPGVGAPVDHPIPASELAVRGTDAPASIDRLLSLLDLLIELARRVALHELAARPASQADAPSPAAAARATPTATDPQPAATEVAKSSAPDRAAAADTAHVDTGDAAREALAPPAAAGAGVGAQVENSDGAEELRGRERPPTAPQPPPRSQGTEDTEDNRGRGDDGLDQLDNPLGPPREAGARPRESDSAAD